MWHTSRDLISNFYHALTMQRITQNRIVRLHDGDGNWIIEDKGVKK